MDDQLHDNVLQISGLTRRFGAVVANNNISLRVRPGTVVGLLGHNGAGKTTLVSQIVGLLRPDAGDIHVGGVNAVRSPAAARRRVALQAQGQAPLDGLTPRTAIEIAARIRGRRPLAARAVAEELADELDITEWLDRRALPDGRGISGGIRRLTAFAMAVAAPTALIVLDEPSNDIDAARRSRLWAAVRRRADAGAGVLLVTHNVTEAERIVDDLVILQAGEVLAAGSPATLRGTQDNDLRLELLLSGEGEQHTQVGRPGFDVRRTVRTGRRVLLTLAAADAAAAVGWARDLRERGRVDGFSLGPASLEEAYLALTRAPATERYAASSSELSHA